MASSSIEDSGMTWPDILAIVLYFIIVLGTGLWVCINESYLLAVSTDVNSFPNPENMGTGNIDAGINKINKGIAHGRARAARTIAKQAAGRPIL